MNGVFTPVINENFVIDSNIERLFARISRLREASPQKCLLVGPHGAGKTELAMQFAAVSQLPMLIMDCANLREPRDWFGSRNVTDGAITWKASVFDKAVSAGNHVILLDELNRVHPSVLNTLIPLLDGRGFTYLEEKGDVIRVGEGTVFFASMNDGHQYTGTMTTDVALSDRFQRRVEVKYLPKDKEVALLMARTDSQ